MSKNILDDKKDPIGRAMRATEILIVSFEIIGLIILGSIFYNIFFK